MTTSPHTPTLSSNQRRAFTLIELIVVVVIIGIVAATAAPKMFSRTTQAAESTAKQQLSAVRSIIETYNADNGSYPGTNAATFKAVIEANLQGPFPVCPVGAKDADVTFTSTGTAISADGNTGWAYDSTSGEFRINHSSYISW